LFRQSRYIIETIKLEISLNEEHLERLPAYIPEPGYLNSFDRFKFEWHNESYRTSVMTWLTLLFLIILFPVANIAFTDDPVSMLESLDDTVRMVLFISTIVIQWFIFLFIYAAVYLENTGLAGIGFKRLRLLDFFWAAAFFGASTLILTGVASLLELIGLPMLGEIKFLIPQDLSGRIVWVVLSLTAGICEETAFRGYLMTRLRLTGKFKSWIIPTIVSALVFGSLHAYQGLPGFIVITIYGAMFSLLFIYTKSIWPGIIAHFFQDFLALFIPQ
jgi:membrane protease YdiL (CAAX protease family)